MNIFRKSIFSKFQNHVVFSSLRIGLDRKLKHIFCTQTCVHVVVYVVHEWKSRKHSLEKVAWYNNESSTRVSVGAKRVCRHGGVYDKLCSEISWSDGAISYVLLIIWCTCTSIVVDDIRSCFSGVMTNNQVIFLYTKKEKNYIVPHKNAFFSACQMR